MQGRFVDIPAIWVVVTLIRKPMAAERRFCGLFFSNEGLRNGLAAGAGLPPRDCQGIAGPLIDQKC